MNGNTEQKKETVDSIEQTEERKVNKQCSTKVKGSDDRGNKTEIETPEKPNMPEEMRKALGDEAFEQIRDTENYETPEMLSKAVRTYLKRLELRKAIKESIEKSEV